MRRRREIAWQYPCQDITTLRTQGNAAWISLSRTLVFSRNRTRRMAPISDKFISPSAPFGLGGMSKMFKRQRYQFGSVERKARKKGPDVWARRYREHLPDGTNCHKSLIVGALAQYATESQARRAAQTLLLRINADNPSAGAVTFGAVIERYLGEELPGRHSTARGYRSWLKNHIKPKWGEYSLEEIKPLAVEQWLKGLDLAPKSKGHLKNQMCSKFNCE